MSEHPEAQSAPTRESLRERIARAIRMAQDGEFSPHGDVVTYGEMADAAPPALAPSPEDVAQVRGLIAFVKDVFAKVHDGHDLDGGEIQDLGVKHGLLQEVVVTKPCGDMCNCDDATDFPTTCYRLNLPAERAYGLTPEEGGR